MVLDFWFLVVKSFSTFFSQIAVQHKEHHVCLTFLEFWCGWLEVKLQTRRKTHLQLKFWNAGVNSSVAFSALYSHTSTFSNLSLIFVDPFVTANNCFVSNKILNTAGEFSEVQTAHLVAITQTKWMFVVSILKFSFINWSTDHNKTAAYFSFVRTLLNANFSHIVFNLDLCREAESQKFWRPNYQKTSIWTLIFTNCWKFLLHEKKLVQSFLPALQADWKRFQMSFSFLLVVLCN